MNNDKQAYCAHTKVTLNFHDYKDGIRSDYWECADGCGTRFTISHLDKPRIPDLLIKRVVIDANGHYWRDFGTHFSMCPVTVSGDNDKVNIVAEFLPSWTPMCDIVMLRQRVAELFEKYEEHGTCTDCGYPVQIVRPGKYQCNHCESIEFLDRQVVTLQSKNEKLQSEAESNLQKSYRIENDARNIKLQEENQELRQQLDKGETLLKMKTETANVFMEQVRKLQTELKTKTQEYEQMKETVIKFLETK